jgi:hypothetical protein
MVLMARVGGRTENACGEKTQRCGEEGERREKRERVSGGGEKNLAGSRHTAAPQKITRRQTEP